MTKVSKIVECPYCATFLDFKYEILKVEDKNGDSTTVGLGNDVIIMKIWHKEECPGCGRPMRSIGEYLK